MSGKTPVRRSLLKTCSFECRAASSVISYGLSNRPKQREPALGEYPIEEKLAEHFGSADLARKPKD
jgi:hypothetical protein